MTPINSPRTTVEEAAEKCPPHCQLNYCAHAMRMAARQAARKERERILALLRETFPKDNDGPYRSGGWFADWLEEELK